ncbi:hypothetical protein B0H13DRAFT_2318241 [Mycena leptocephala]|nr:hypothetical protein B0H13DRAFT_2318241 [Mycena leptocephala]
MLSMKPSTSLVALLSLASVVVSSAITARGVSSCKASDRVLVDTQTVTAAGHKFQISTKACSADALTSRSLEKRVTFQLAHSRRLCCLSNAIVAAFEGPGQPTLFTVSPQFVQEFSLGTCLWAWINNNPVGGATLQYCYSGLTGVLGFNLDNSCIVPGDTGGFVTARTPCSSPLRWTGSSKSSTREFLIHN